MEDAKYAEGIMRCTRCPDMCACACPVFDVLKTQSVTPSNKAHAAQMLEEGLLDPQPEVVEILYQCNNCRLCAEWCIYDDLVLGDLLKEARKRIYLQAPGSLPDFVLNLRKRVIDSGTLHPVRPPDPADPVREKLRSFQSAEGEVLLFEGGYARAQTPEITLAALALLRRMGVKPAYLPAEEPGCGADAALLGFQDLALESGSETARFLNDSGFPIVVALSPQCAWQLTEGFSDLGINLDVEVLSLPAYLDSILQGRSADWKDMAGISIVLDDDAFLSRYLDQADLPYQILERIPGCHVLRTSPQGKLADPAVSYSPLPSPAAERGVRQRKAAQLTSAGAEIVVTTSPQGKRQLQDLLAGQPQVLDLAELLLSALP